MVSIKMNHEYAIPMAAAGIFSMVAAYFVGKSEFVRGTKFGYNGGYNDACCNLIDGLREAEMCVKKDVNDMINEMQTLIDGGTVDPETSVLKKSNLSKENIDKIINTVANGNEKIRMFLMEKYLSE